jgi:hypothetical protein
LNSSDHTSVHFPAWLLFAARRSIPIAAKSALLFHARFGAAALDKYVVGSGREFWRGEKKRLRNFFMS